MVAVPKATNIRMNEMLAKVLSGGEREVEGAAPMAAAHRVQKVEVGRGGGRPSIQQLGRRQP